MADEKDTAQEKINNLPVKVGQHYHHFKSHKDTYEIIAIAIQEDTLEPLVIYRSLKRGTVWSRTAENFMEEIEREGKKMKRFEHITENGLTESEEAEILKASREAKEGKNVSRFMNPQEAVEYLDSL
ncbi:MAG: DUF1653 domain-containing protein [Candidatus Andersenbacteria bacterium]|nr:DUF1653 domain-containing protein [Candidatus Andersenbacteria bacterium]